MKQEDKVLIADFINNHIWTFAKTYAKRAPHEYVVRKELNEEDQKRFDRFCELIDEFGYKERFFKVYFTYINIGKYKYWHMRGGDTHILNRASQ